MAKKNAAANTTETVEVLSPISNAAEATEGQTTTTAEATEEGATADEAVEKRTRNYSQSAIDKADLERLNTIKADVKERTGLVVSNQSILRAALDCLVAGGLDAFCDRLKTTATERQRESKLKAFAALKATLEADGLLVKPETE